MSKATAKRVAPVDQSQNYDTKRMESMDTGKCPGRITCHRSPQRNRRWHRDALKRYKQTLPGEWWKARVRRHGDGTPVWTAT